MFDIIRNVETGRVERMIRRFGKDNGKKIDIVYFAPAKSVFVHLNDLKKSKSVSLSKAEMTEFMEFQMTMNYAMNLVETDGIEQANQDEQQQQQQQQQQQAQQQHYVVYADGPSAPKKTKKKTKDNE